MASNFDRLKEALSDRYLLERELGHGGMATVFLATDLRHKRQVAVKVIHPELTQAVGGQRFIREIGIAARLQHPNILTLIDSGEAVGLLYYVMPFVDGETLRSRVAREGPLSVAESMRLFREIVEAIAYAHGHGMIHRDIKPDNIMLSNRHVLILDFGVAKAVDEPDTRQHLTTAGHSLGTPAYMAPEQVTADPNTDKRADIYSAGIVAYEMLVGRTPFTGNAQQIMSAHVITAPQRVSTVRSEIPGEVDRIVMRCLEKEPDKRYSSADELLNDLESLITPLAPAIEPAGDSPRLAKKPVFLAAVAIAIVGIAAAGYWLTAGIRRERWIRNEAVPAIQRYIEAGANDSAFFAARNALAIAPGDSLVKALLPRFSRSTVISTEPAGASVYLAYAGDTSHWESIGTTPTDTIRLPAPPSAIRIRIEKDGFQTVNRLGFIAPRVLILDSATSERHTTIRIPGGSFIGALPGLDNQPPIELGDFRIDRHEVTNREFKKFVDAGGYRDSKYWEFSFEYGGKKIGFAEAVTHFIDRTGRSGPATWEAGDIPSGQEEFPVAGLSWYEASAYAKFSGRMLPTVYHWARAATVPLSAYIVPYSNFGGQGPARGNNGLAISGYGVYDMAGNLREWCYNATGKNRYILGGGWNDQPYMAIDVNTQDPFDRSATNGVRLMSLVGAENNLVKAQEPLIKGIRDYASEKPASDAEFQTLLRAYDYDKLPLNAKVEQQRDEKLYTREKITFAAAYRNERVTAYLYLPKQGARPYQTVVYFPGSNALHTRTAEGNLEIERVDFLLKSGRAVMYPIYKSTYERKDSLDSDYGDTTIFYRDHVVMWANDLRRSVDYLATRKDIDSSKLGYYGISWGGTLGAIMLAVEQRFKAAVLYVAGLPLEHSRREADQINFLPRVRIPVIMLNGKYDFFFPVESSQKPFFRLIGTLPENKKYIVYEGGHFVPRTQLIAESLTWFDRYLGPAK